jgi:hypothetical protein
VTHMWEARCAAGRLDEAVAWVQQRVAAEALEAGAHTAEVFRSAADGAERVVLLTRWPAPTAWVEPVADPALVERSHAWPFDAVGDR